jgi:hypothetical protein
MATIFTADDMVCSVAYKELSLRTNPHCPMQRNSVLCFLFMASEDFVSHHRRYHRRGSCGRLTGQTVQRRAGSFWRGCAAQHGMGGVWWGGCGCTSTMSGCSAQHELWRLVGRGVVHAGDEGEGGWGVPPQ